MKTKFKFFLHNTVNHPLAGLCWLVGAMKAGDAVHDENEFEVAGCLLLLVLVVGFFVVKTPSVEEVFAQADKHAAEVSNGH